MGLSETQQGITIFFGDEQNLYTGRHLKGCLPHWCEFYNFTGKMATTACELDQNASFILMMIQEPRQGTGNTSTN